MTKKPHNLFFRGLQIFAIVALVCAPVTTFAKDIAGSSDHSLITRYPGSTIIKYEESELADYVIPLSAPKRASSRQYVAEKSQAVRGKVTRLVYQSKQEASALQIYENYLDALSQPGFEVFHQCQAKSCKAVAKLYARGMNQYRASYKDKSDAYYAVAKYQQEDQKVVYIVVLVGINNSGNTIIAVDVIESRSLELGKVTSNADALLESLMQTGRAQVYDIYFDTGKSAVKPESANALDAIKEVLERRPELHLYVVGHTDDTGSLSFNNTLSQERATAVVKALFANGVRGKERLYGKGVGPFAPVASNEDEAGRAKNRRVELVRRLN